MSLFVRRFGSFAVAISAALAVAPGAAGAVGGPSPGAVSAQTMAAEQRPRRARGVLRWLRPLRGWLAGARECRVRVPDSNTSAA